MPFVQGFIWRRGSQETNTWGQWFPQDSHFQVVPLLPLSRITTRYHAHVEVRGQLLGVGSSLRQGLPCFLLLCDPPVSASQLAVGGCRFGPLLDPGERTQAIGVQLALLPTEPSF